MKILTLCTESLQHLLCSQGNLIIFSSWKIFYPSMLVEGTAQHSQNFHRKKVVSVGDQYEKLYQLCCRMKIIEVISIILVWCYIFRRRRKKKTKKNEKKSCMHCKVYFLSVFFNNWQWNCSERAMSQRQGSLFAWAKYCVQHQAELYPHYQGKCKI